MVSRIYTPLIPPYSRPAGPAGTTGPAAQAVEEDVRQAPLRWDDNASRRNAPAPQAVQYDHTRKIPLDAVIHDFRNTMGALSVDDHTRAEVAAYLNVVRLQAAKEQPEVPFIKHTLKTAANSLDQFIGKALGQPSRVVKEWVDALLMQDIDYHADIPPEEVQLGASPKTADATTAMDAIADEPTSASVAHGGTEALPADRNGLSRLKTLIENAQADHKAGKHAEADGQLQTALELLDGQNRPDWEGKVLHLRGKFYDRAGRWEEAVSFFGEAAGRFETAQLPRKQAGSLHAMAGILEAHGRLEQAEGAYRQVLALDRASGDVRAQIRSLNDLGGVHLQRGAAEPAIETLDQAAALMRGLDVPPEMAGDIFSNLGAAYRLAGRYDEAIGSYGRSLRAAKTARDRTGYMGTLRQMAAVLLEANQPDKAMAALKRLQAMSV